MKKKILFTVYIIIICISLKILYNITLNSFFINRYNDGEYIGKIAENLTHFNIVQKYIAHYNYGNSFYQNGEYENAIEEYKRALKGIVPRNKECSIRINYALSICKLVHADVNDKDSIKKAIETYESAIDVLTEDGCAHKNDNNGHSQKAEQLKQDILEEIEKLKNLQAEEQNNTEDNKDKKEESKDKTKEIEEKIKQIEEEALKEQKEVEKRYNIRFDFNKVERNW